MALKDRLRHQVTIERSTVTVDVDDQPIENDWGQSVPAWSAVATVPAWVQPLDIREQQQLSGAGSVAITNRVFILPTDVTEEDRLRFDGRLLEIDSVIDAAGKDHHLELLCHSVSA